MNGNFEEMHVHIDIFLNIDKYIWMFMQFTLQF